MVIFGFSDLRLPHYPLDGTVGYVLDRVVRTLYACIDIWNADKWRYCCWRFCIIIFKIELLFVLLVIKM